MDNDNYRDDCVCVSENFLKLNINNTSLMNYCIIYVDAKMQSTRG